MNKHNQLQRRYKLSIYQIDNLHQTNLSIDFISEEVTVFAL
jgi:hypothetical protein